MTIPRGLGKKGGAGLPGKLLLISVVWFMVGECLADEEYTLIKSVGKYYKFHNRALRWYEAVAACRYEGSELALPTSRKEVEALVAIFNRYPEEILTPSVTHGNQILIGLNDAYVEGEYLDQKGKPLLFTNWRPGEPNNVNKKENCGSMFRSGSFNDILCTVPYAFICENKYKPKKIVPNTEYQLIRSVGKYYKFHNRALRWHQAMAACRDEGAELALPTSNTEVEALVQLFKRYPKSVLPTTVTSDNQVMIGFNDAYVKGEYLDQKGNPLISIKWGPGAPSNKDNKYDCGAMYRSGMFNDILCTVPYVFICQKEYKPKEIVPNIDIFYSLDFKQRYSLHLSPRNWTDAAAMCKKENSTLAIINNEEEAQLLVRALSLYPEESLEGSYDKTRVFLGFRKGDHVKEEIETDLDDLVELPKYDMRASIDEIPSLCGAMRRDGLLTEVDCDVPAMFICESPEKQTVKSVSVQRRFESAE